MQKLKDESVAAWEGKKKEVQAAQDAKKESVSKVQEAIWENKKEIERLNAEVLESEEQMKDVKRKVADKRYEKEFQEYLSGRKSENYEYLRRQMVSRVYTLREEEEDAYRKLVEERSSYIREYPNRTFSTSIRDNAPYEKLFEFAVLRSSGDLQGSRRRHRRKRLWSISKMTSSSRSGVRSWRLIREGMS